MRALYCVEMSKTIAPNAEHTFKKQLLQYKELIDADIKAYTKQVQASTLQTYGANARVEMDAFLSILARGGKRLRGALVMAGYEMCGGKDRKMIIQAARALEMVHAHMLIVDDMQDRSRVRRGGPAGHVILADYHARKHLAGDSEHFGLSVAMNAGISGEHAAQIILSNLNVDPQLRLNVLAIVNQTIITTAHGQTGDIMNEMVADVSMQEILNVLQWKSAEYTFLNPLCVGMVLAGAGCEDTDAIREYALAAGMAFQIGDDILSTFGNEFESGKSPMDDLREGKRTLIVAYALLHGSKVDKTYLIEMLGNPALTPAQFECAKAALVSSGAVEYAQTEMKQYVQQATKALDANQDRWNADSVAFLRSLAEYLLTRNA